jgi:hypothetical protein
VVKDMRRRGLLFHQYCVRIVGGYAAYVSAGHGNQHGPLWPWLAVTQPRETC